MIVCVCGDSTLNNSSCRLPHYFLVEPEYSDSGIISAIISLVWP